MERRESICGEERGSTATLLATPTHLHHIEKGFLPWSIFVLEEGMFWECSVHISLYLTLKW